MDKISKYFRNLFSNWRTEKCPICGKTLIFHSHIGIQKIKKKEWKPTLGSYKDEQE